MCSPMQVKRDGKVQRSFRSAGSQLIQLLHSLLPDVIQLGDGVIQGRNLLLLQILCPLCHHLYKTRLSNPLREFEYKGDTLFIKCALT